VRRRDGKSLVDTSKVACDTRGRITHDINSQRMRIPDGRQPPTAHDASWDGICLA
jgi:hypothetical protein